MTIDKQMIFRYDNAKHYPEMCTYPHHKHLVNDLKECNEPEFFDVLIEIQDLIKTN